MCVCCRPPLPGQPHLVCVCGVRGREEGGEDEVITQDSALRLLPWGMTPPTSPCQSGSDTPPQGTSKRTQAGGSSRRGRGKRDVSIVNAQVGGACLVWRCWRGGATWKRQTKLSKWLPLMLTHTWPCPPPPNPPRVPSPNWRQPDPGSDWSCDPACHVSHLRKMITLLKGVIARFSFFFGFCFKPRMFDFNCPRWRLTEQIQGFFF